jgi:hypothetical protein
MLPMNQDPAIREICEDAILSGVGDSVGLWELVWGASRRAPAATDDEIRSLVVRAVRDLVDGGYMEVGDLFSRGVFVPWLLDSDFIVDWIEREWTQLGQAPSLGDICWLRQTPLGESTAQALLVHHKSESRDGSETSDKP